MAEEEDNSAPDEDALKRVAFYQEMISGWLTTQFEAGRQAVGLSGLAIGLLMTFRGQIDALESLVLWGLAAVFFLVSVLVGMKVFYLNAQYIEELVGGNSMEKEKKIITRIATTTRCIYGLFIVGAFFTGALAATHTPYFRTLGDR